MVGFVFFESKSLLEIERQKKLKKKMYHFEPKASDPCQNIDISNAAYSLQCKSSSQKFQVIVVKTELNQSFRQVNKSTTFPLCLPLCYFSKHLKHAVNQGCTPRSTYQPEYSCHVARRHSWVSKLYEYTWCSAGRPWEPLELRYKLYQIPSYWLFPEGNFPS